MADRIGKYEIVRLIGRGGMAAVYEAVDPDLRRRVALKVLASDADARLVDRLHREAVAVARLRHPNIVVVHDVGSAEGAHFIAMELVEGRTLADLRPEMPVRPRLEAVLVVARAVAHAHRHGVVHRDLKPQNVLVEQSTRQLFLTDFGLARVAGVDGLTRSGAAVGTPLYMAPEQVRGDKDAIAPHTDVWALGVMLHEMLADGTPFAGTTLATVYDAIQHREPPGLPRAWRAVETVCLKALEKEPHRRYANAGDFADDLERAIRGEPVAARPPSRMRRAWVHVRRHPLPVALVVVALVVAPGVVAVQRAAAVRHHVSEAERLLASRDIEALIRADAHARFAGRADLRLAVNRRLGELALESGDYELARLALTVAMPEAEASALIAGRRDAVLRDRASRLRAALDDLRAGLGRRGRPAGAPGLDDYLFECVRYDDEQTVELLAASLAPLSPRAGEPHESWTEDERALMKFCFVVLGRLRRPSAVRPLAELMARLRDPALAVECGLALANTRAPGAYAPLLAARERFGHNSAVWEQISRALPRVPEPEGAEPATADDFVRRGLARHERGDDEGALRDYARAIELDPGNACAYGNRGSVRRDRGDLDGAMDDFERALAIEPRHTGFLNNRGIARRARGDLDGALRDYERAMALAPDDALAYGNRAVVRHDRGDFKGAVEDFSTVIRLDPLCASAYVNRSSSRRELGDRNGAIADLTEALKLDPRNTALYNNLGNLRFDARDFEGAARELTRAIEIDPRNALAYCNRGAARHKMGDIRGALDDLDRALQCDPKCGGALCNRGLIRVERGDLDGALADYARAAEIDPRDVPAILGCGQVNAARRDFAAAAADFSRAIELAPRHVGARVNRGCARKDLGDMDGALADFDRALELEPGHFYALANRGNARVAKGNLDGAIEDYTRALEQDARNAALWSSRGLAKYQKQDVDAAFADLTRAIELDPGPAGPYCNRGLVRRVRSEMHAAAGRAEAAKAELEGAIEDYTRALSIDPNLAAAYSNRGFARRDAGDLAGAVADWEKFVALAPDHPHVSRVREEIRKARASLEK